MSKTFSIILADASSTFSQYFASKSIVGDYCFIPQKKSAQSTKWQNLLLEEFNPPEYSFEEKQDNTKTKVRSNLGERDSRVESEDSDQGERV